MHNSRKIAFRRAVDVCMHYCTFIEDDGSNRFESHSVVLNRSFTNLQWLLNNDYPVGGNRKERSHEINYPSLGLHAILDMRDKSLAGRTHSCILDKGGGNRTK